MLCFTAGFPKLRFGKCHFNVFCCLSNLAQILHGLNILLWWKLLELLTVHILIGIALIYVPVSSVWLRAHYQLCLLLKILSARSNIIRIGVIVTLWLRQLISLHIKRCYFLSLLISHFIWSNWNRISFHIHILIISWSLTVRHILSPTIVHWYLVALIIRNQRMRLLHLGVNHLLILHVYLRIYFWCYLRLVHFFVCLRFVASVGTVWLSRCYSHLRGVLKLRLRAILVGVWVVNLFGHFVFVFTTRLPLRLVYDLGLLIRWINCLIFAIHPRLILIEIHLRGVQSLLLLLLKQYIVYNLLLFWRYFLLSDHILLLLLEVFEGHVAHRIHLILKSSIWKELRAYLLSVIEMNAISWHRAWH